MEVKFNIIKPNLYIVEDHIFFGIDTSDVISVSKTIDEVVKRNIGILKVKENDLETLESGKSKKSEKMYNVQLIKYLDALERKSRHGVGGITTPAADIFGLDYVVDAQTIEKSEDRNNWRLLEIHLADPEKTFNTFDENNLVYRLDRQKTLDLMKRLHQELDSKIPENYAELVIVNGYLAFEDRPSENKNFGSVGFMQLKAKDKTKIEDTKTQLVEELKKISGPCLSLDAPEIYSQMIRLFEDAPTLMQRYGDVLRSPAWQTRFFRLDP